MKKLGLLLLLPLLLFSQERKQFGNIVTEDIPTIPDRIVEKMNQYQSVRGASFTDWSPDGKGMLISTRFGETNQYHFVEMPGGARKQITFFREPVGNGAFYPGKNKKMFLFTKDVGGGEFFQLYSFDMNTGSYEMLTDGKSRNGGGLWNNSGKQFVFTSTKRNGKDNDIYIAGLNDPKNASLLMEVNGSWGVQDWSADDTKMLVGQYISVTESYLYSVDAATGAKTQINPGQKIAYGGAKFSQDGKGIYYTSDEFGEYQQLIYLDLASGKKLVISRNVSWDVSDFEVSKTGKYLAYEMNQGGISTLTVLDGKTRKEIVTEKPPVGIFGSWDFNDTDTHLALTINTSQTPGDVYVLDLKTKKFTRWTYSEVGGLNTDNFVIPKLIEYKTFDGKMIPALYYAPKKLDKPTATVIVIHGGPEGQSQPNFSSLSQYWVNELGIAVIFPNVRGSTGYGKTYVSLDNGFQREHSVKDIGALLDWIETQPELDKNRIAVYGGSYGGYMVLSSMFNYNDRLKCGIDVVGISNFVTFLESTQEYRRDLRRVEYGDERDTTMRKHLMAISPTTNAYKITKPLFVAQGKNDPRVPYTEAEQIVSTVRKNGKPVWYMMALDEGHGFQKKLNRDYFNNAMTLFWEEYLLK
ncbi:MAG: prolyl oligopeptidase family serine peptidase [Bacteroidota bacterium]